MEQVVTDKPAEAADGTVPGTPPAARSRRAYRADLTALATYLILAVWVTGRLWADVRHRTLSAYPFDQAFFEWVYAHGARVVTEGTNPFFTTQLNMPDGINMMANNSQLGLAIPLAPVTLLFGPQVTFALVTTASLAFTGYGWYHVLSRHLVASRLAAFLGGAVATFGHGFLSHAGGQLNVITNFLLPFIVWRALKLREPGRAVRNGVLLALLVTYQVFIAEEPLLIAALALGVFVGGYALLRRDEARADARTFLTGLGVCALVSGVLLAYPLYVQFFGPQHYRGIMEIASGVGAKFPSYTGRSLPWLDPAGYEQDSLSWPLTAVTIGVGVLLWQQPRVRALVLTSGIFVVFAIGPYLRADNGTPILPMPYFLIKDLPVFDALVPARLQLACQVIAGILVALGWDELTRLSAASRPALRRAGFAAAALLLVPVVPAQLGTAAVVPPPGFIADGTWRGYVEPGRTIVPVPLPKMNAVEGMRWSASTNLEFAIPAGYFFGPGSKTDKRAWYWPEDRPTTTLLQYVADTGTIPPVSEDMREQARTDLRYWRAAVVVLPPRQHQAALHDTLEQLLGPSQYIGGVWIWDVRAVGAG